MSVTLLHVVWVWKDHGDCCCHRGVQRSARRPPLHQPHRRTRHAENLYLRAPIADLQGWLPKCCWRSQRGWKCRRRPAGVVRYPKSSCPVDWSRSHSNATLRRHTQTPHCLHGGYLVDCCARAILYVTEQEDDYLINIGESLTPVTKL